MKRTMIFLVVCALAGACAQAQVIGEQQARQMADSYFTASDNATPARAAARRGAGRATLAYTANSSDGSPAFYVFNRGDEGGFVIVSADERTTAAILAYSDQGSFAVEDMPDNVSGWLEGYTEQISALREANATGGHIVTATGTPVVEPLITTQWDQEDPFNAKTPKLSGEHTPAGCVAVATAQIMNYHRWPNRGTGSIEYEWHNSYLDCDFEDCVYDWDDLDVAQLLCDVGIACQTSYGESGSSSYDWNAGHALITYFGYDKGMQLHFRSMCGDWNPTAWDDMLRAELDAHRPVYYSGVLKKGRSSIGHSFVCDGYDSEGYFHFNFGWSGFGDGWFVTQAVNPDDETHGYNADQSVITHIMPDAGGQPWLGAVTQGQGITDGGFWALMDTKMEGTTCYEDERTGKKYYASVMPFTLDPLKLINLGNNFPEGDHDFVISWADGHEDYYYHIDLPDGTYKKYRVFRLQGTDEWQTYDFNYGRQFGDQLRETFVWMDVAAGKWTQSSSLNFGDDMYSYRILNDHEAYINELKDRNVTTITIPATATYRGMEYAVAGVCDIDCQSATEIVLPEGLRFIGDDSTIGGIRRFNGTSITLPSTLEMIGANGIYCCPNLSSITIPASVKGLGKNALSGNEGLKTVTFAEGISLKELSEGCFQGCKRLKNIVLPPSLERMSASCFYQCGSLKEITIPAGVRFIGQAAFSCCTNLEHIEFPEDSQLEVIDGGFNEYDGTFCETENLEYISFPPSLKEFNDNFNSCGIKYADFSRTQIAMLGEEDETSFYNCHGLETVLLPPTIRKIGYLFQNCEKVTSFVIPEGTEEIRGLGCTNIQSLVIPASVKQFDNFSCNPSTIVICEGMTPPEGMGLTDYIYGREFKEFTLYVPAGAKQTYQEYELLYGRYNHPYHIMVPIYEMASETSTNVVADAASATVMGSASNESSLVLPSTVETSYGEVPVTTIADYAFMGNGTLTSVDIPSSVGTGASAAIGRHRAVADAQTGIGEYAFAYCMNMDTVRVHWTTPLVIDDTVFRGLELSGLTLIVPDGTLSAYSAASVWKKFGTIAEETAAGFDLLQPDADTLDAPLYDLFGRCISQPQRGTVYIQGGKKIIKQ